MGFNWFALSNGPEQTFEFRCDCCGRIHAGSPSFAYNRPFAYFIVPEDERDSRIEIDSDTCAIDGESFYIRTILEIPIHGADEPFTWGVWVSPAAQRRADVVCLVFGLGLTAVSLSALVGAITVDETAAQKVEERMLEAKLESGEITKEMAEHKASHDDHQASATIPEND